MTVLEARDLTRRRFLGGAAGLGLGVALTACGADSSDDGAGGSGGAGGGDGEFPANVAHKYGRATIDKSPARVATLGGSDVDTLLALGVVPVVIPDIDPRWKTGVGPWSERGLGSKKPVKTNRDQVDFERIASARPDLITAVETDLQKGDYDKLAKLSPTVAPPKGYPAWGVPWDEITLQVGASLGRREDAQKLVDDTRALYEKARRDNPKWEGKKVALVNPDEDGGMYVFSESDVRTRFLADLGFVQPAGLKKLFKGEFYAQISAERFDLLEEADALIVVATDPTQRKALESSPTFGRLDVVTGGRVVRVEDPDLGIAMSYCSPPATPWTLERIVPRLRDAVA